MTKELKWRLGKLPTPDEVLKLVNDKLITKEEAREILFNEEEKTERDVKSLEEEIKFLRELVEKLSNGNRNVIVETIKYVEKPYYRFDWYRPYGIWTGTLTLNDNITLCGGGSGTTYLGNAVSTNCSFSALQTF